MKILLLAGGDSSERSVSLTSGAAIYKALQRLGHTVLAVDPATGKSLLDTRGEFVAPASADVTLPAGRGAHMLAGILTSPGFADVDLVFVGLHGGRGENGVVQCLLSLAGMPFTGSDMTASAVAMNKAMAKRLFSTVEIPTPEWELYRVQQGDNAESLSAKITGSFDLPIIVKPNDGGSTIGLTRVDDTAALPGAIESALTESHEVLVERYIAGRELTVAVLDNHAFPVVEIRPKSGLYDFEAKYTKGKTEYLAPAPIDDDLASRLQAAALRAYDVIGASGLARVDFILDENDNFFILELNSLPGMTELSLAPMAAACEGISFDDLVRRMIDSALNTTRSSFG